MSEVPKLTELKDISHDIESFNRFIADAFAYSVSGDQRKEISGATWMAMSQSILRDRLFRAAIHNPFLHIRLTTGQYGIDSKRLLPVTARESAGRIPESLGSIAAWDTVDLATYDGIGDMFNVGDDVRRMKLPTIGRTISEGGRLFIEDETPILIDGEPLENE